MIIKVMNNNDNSNYYTYHSKYWMIELNNNKVSALKDEKRDMT